MRRKRVGRREEEQGAAELFDLALPCYLFEQLSELQHKHVLVNV